MGLALMAAVAIGCAPKAGAPTAAAPDPTLAALADADAAARAGCYACLERALQGYERVLAARPDGETGHRAYQIAVRLAIRERVLGLYPGAHQESPSRLRAWASPDDADDAEAIVPSVAWRRGTLGVLAPPLITREELGPLRARRRQLESRIDSDGWRAELLLALMATQPFVAVDEDQLPSGPIPSLDPQLWEARHPDDASLTFTRLALLGSDTDAVTVFQVEHPSFTEAWVVIGELEIRLGRLLSADAALSTALEALPGLTAAQVLRGDIRQRMEDFESAVQAYEVLLAHVPEHREGLLGHVRSLGYLGRHEAAIAAADRMLALGTWYLGEAHYWKAWNLFQQRRIEASRTEVERARRLQINADVEYLSGVIAFRQSRPTDAIRDFDSATRLESAHCEARFDRAAVRLVSRDWATASLEFDDAFACLAARTSTLEARIAEAKRADLPDALRAVVVARREQAFQTHRHQQGWARYNAAVAYANLGRAEERDARLREVIVLGGPAVDAARDLRAQLRIE